MIVALVLAAGRSERVGRPKALLPCGETTFLRSILNTLSTSRVDEYRVVLGHEAAAIRSASRIGKDVCVVNESYRDGMLSSVQCGIRALPRQTAGFLLWPVDHPLVRTETVDLLVREFRRSLAPVVVPVHGGRRGHPVVFHERSALELLEAPADRGARAVVHAHRTDRVELEVEDAGVTTDINTPEAYQRAFGKPLPLS